MTDECKGELLDADCTESNTTHMFQFIYKPKGQSKYIFLRLATITNDNKVDLLICYFGASFKFVPDKIIHEKTTTKKYVFGLFSKKSTTRWIEYVPKSLTYEQKAQLKGYFYFCAVNSLKKQAPKAITFN